MTFKTYLGALTIAGLLVGFTGFAQAAGNEVILPQPEITVTANTSVSISAVNDDSIVTASTTELSNMKIKEQDPTVGPFTKFILRIKIRQLENQLNIKKALK